MPHALVEGRTDNHTVGVTLDKPQSTFALLPTQISSTLMMA